MNESNVRWFARVNMAEGLMFGLIGGSIANSKYAAVAVHVAIYAILLVADFKLYMALTKEQENK